MMIQKSGDPAKIGNSKPAKHISHAANSMFDKIMGKCQANIKAIDLLDGDQKEYLSRNAKVSLAARRKKKKKRLKK